MIIDSFGHWISGLGATARWIGKEKISLDGVGGKSDYYWKHNMRKLLDKFPEQFWKYALNDSKILMKLSISGGTFSYENSIMMF